jgi:ELWxxDGT repeat protein
VRQHATRLVASLFWLIVFSASFRVEAATVTERLPGTFSNLTEFNGLLFFTADDGLTGTELWKTNGSFVGTELVKDINPGNASSSPLMLTVINGKLFFVATTAASGTEIWCSDGTEAGRHCWQTSIRGRLLG